MVFIPELLATAGPLKMTPSAHVLAKIVGAGDTAVNVAPGNCHRVRIPIPPGQEGAFVARFVNNNVSTPA